LNYLRGLGGVGGNEDDGGGVWEIMSSVSHFCVVPTHSRLPEDRDGTGQSPCSLLSFLPSSMGVAWQ
jgi:hypothetical protein